MEEVLHVPARPLIPWLSDALSIFAVVFPKELHANQSEDKDDDGQDDGEVPQCPH